MRIFLEATVKLGVPMILLSWWIFNWLYSGGDLDRKADRKTVNAQIKKIGRKLKKKKQRGHADYVMSKWMWFGSGFYGLAALWTFVVIELTEIWAVILDPTRIVDAFDDGIIAAVIQLLLNQLGNMISALIWFAYWPQGGLLIWVLVGYFGYWVGVELARRDDELQIQHWLQRLRRRDPNRR